ncbi:MAG: type I-E CRISPR-associated protein Cas5/CasD [bacterium]
MKPNTLFLRLEGPLQSWGDHQSEFVIRRTAEAPTKSGVAGIICAAKGLTRENCADLLNLISDLSMAVRIDRPGVRWWDFHTVGAGKKMRSADGSTRREPIVSRREYLCNASFLVALQGNQDLIEEIENALSHPRWQLYLGRKCCVPSCPILDPPSGWFETLDDALLSRPLRWIREFGDESKPQRLECIIEWKPTPKEPQMPRDAEIWYDTPLSFKPPVHAPRIVVRRFLEVGDGKVPLEPIKATAIPNRLQRPHADYKNSAFREIRDKRLNNDRRLCVFCKSPATTVQHITYRRAGGREEIDDLRSLCRICHDAVTMIEYGLSMGLDRINPEDERWRELIIKKREEIIAFRSVQLRKRLLAIEMEEEE